jgi:3D (Asp-Asp-Asp) domain-containing protein
VAASKSGGREHQALLELYALDSRLQASQARVAYLARGAGKLRRERKALRSELRASRAMLTTTQRQLAYQLRMLYEQGGVDPLAVMFGATSLTTGLRDLEDLRRSAAVSSHVIAATRAAERRFLRARRTLAAAAQRLARSLVSARAAERSFVAAVAGKSAFVAALRARGTAEAAGLLSTAGAAAKKSQAIGGHTPPPQPPPKDGRKMVVSATCYILKGTTASGLPVGPGIVAVDPTVIPLGTRMFIPGYGKGIAADTGGGIKGKIIDLWYATYAQCAKWGRRTVTITIYY